MKKAIYVFAICLTIISITACTKANEKSEPYGVCPYVEK